MKRKERKEITLKFNQEIKALYLKGIKPKEIALLKGLTNARVYQILELKQAKTKTNNQTA